jgi:hypothetical protein
MAFVPAAAIQSSHRARVEQIAPTKARRLLRQNRHNRNLRALRVKELAGAMRRGEWDLNGETIKIAQDGTLLDGQHRLQAVIDSGVTIETVVVRGLPLSAQDTVDTGRRRRLADMLALEGHSDPNTLAAALNALHRHRNELRLDGARRTAPTPQQALALIAATPGIFDSVRAARRVNKKIGGPIGVFAALHCEFCQADPSASEQFFEQLEDGADLSSGDPLLHLRNHLISPRKDRSYAQQPFHIAALMIKAFNLRRAGQTVEVLAYKRTEGFPTIECAKRS